MYVNKNNASVEQLLEYVGPCVEEVPAQPDWENLGSQRVDDLIDGLSKLAASKNCWPTPMDPPRSYAPSLCAASKNQSSSASSRAAPSALGVGVADDDIKDLMECLVEASVGESMRRYVFLFA